jgi:putative ATPase
MNVELICFFQVNAANSMLAHGGGVAGAVRSAGGPAIQKESDQWVKKHGSVETGQVAVTGPGNMICRHVIHAGMDVAVE